MPAAASPAGRVVVLLTMCLGVLIAQVNTSVVNLAMQPIGASFHASVAQLQWVLNAYNLAYAVLLLSGGLLADMLGRRRIFVLGAALMALAALGCGFAGSIGMLIAGCAMSGIGAALMVPASLAIIRVVWPEPAARGRALGIWASCNGLAFVIGPVLGGLLISQFGWRSVFFPVVPLGLITCLLAWAATPDSADPQGRRFDLPGQIAGAAVLGALAFAAIAAHGGSAGSLIWLAVALAALVLFIAVERRAGPAALVPLDLFRRPAFNGAAAATAAMTFGIYGMIFLLPLSWLSSGLLSPREAGFALMPTALVFFLISMRSGSLAQRFGRRSLTATGTALIGCGLLVLAASEAGQPLALAEAGLLLAGIGMGLNTGPLLAIAVDAVSAARAGTASALINVARMSGATLGVALLGTVYGLAGGGAPGLRAAMLTGGGVQLCGALAAWLTQRSPGRR
ncbi:MAG TPA: MFS transporter [Alphaproteobacteria bacterium]